MKNDVFARTLVGAPNDFGYALEKVGAWVRELGPFPVVVQPAIQQMRNAIQDFTAAVNATGRNPDKMPAALTHDVPHILYAVNELERYLRTQDGDIRSSRAAMIFVEFLWAKFGELLEIAREFDRYYPMA